MKKLLKEYGFSCPEQYYRMIIESFVNGQYTQVKEQFKALTKKERKECCIFASEISINGFCDKAVLFFIKIL